MKIFRESENYTEAVSLIISAVDTSSEKMKVALIMSQIEVKQGTIKPRMRGGGV